MIDDLFLFILLALLAEILGTVGGFGSSLFFVPIASFFLDFHSVLGITAMFHVFSNISKVALFRKGFDQRLVVLIGIPAVVFVIIGAYLSKFFETKLLEILLSIVLISVSLLLIFFSKYGINPTKRNSFLGGMFSGFIAGLVGTGGAIRGLTLAAFNLKMEAFIATSAFIDLLIDSSRTIVYYMNGYVHQDDLYLIPILLLVSITGTYVGKKLLRYFTEERFRSMVLFLVLLTGVVTLVGHFR